jgi:hypothetical protein
MRTLIYRYAITVILTALMTIPLQCAEKAAGNPESVIEKLAPAVITEVVPAKTTRLQVQREQSGHCPHATEPYFWANRRSPDVFKGRNGTDGDGTPEGQKASRRQVSHVG